MRIAQHSIDCGRYGDGPALGVPRDRYEFQVLYGMAEPVRKGLLRGAGRIRLYCPFGELIPGMGYLVRRLLENTANESFLRQSFAEEHELAQLLEYPRTTLERQSVGTRPESSHSGGGGLSPFRNEPVADFTKSQERLAFRNAIASVRGQLGRTYPLFIDGNDVATDDVVASVNPANPSEVIGRVCQAGTAEVDSAIGAARNAFRKWRNMPAEQRAHYLLKAADMARGRLHTLAAWQILEVGKQWDQAHADVAECIDFFEYYAREMMRLALPHCLGTAPGELNLYFYEPKGIAAVIAPWNFPLAISGGMSRPPW